MKALRSLDLRILSFLAEHDEGTNIFTLSTMLNQKKQNIYNHIKKLKNKGFVEPSNRFWVITAQGLVQVKNALRSQVHDQPSKRIFMGLIYRHKRPLSPTAPVQLLQEAKDLPFQPVNLHNTNQAFIKVNLTARITSQTLTIYSKDFYFKRGQLSIEQESLLKTSLDAYARELERRLHLDLLELKRGVLASAVLQEEVADEHHPLAEATPKHESKIVLARLPEDGKERLIADMSKGFKELEAVHASHAGEDSDTLDKQFNALLDGKINLLDIPALMAITQKNTLLIQQYAKQIELHLKIMKKIDRRLNQRTLRGWD